MPDGGRGCVAYSCERIAMSPYPRFLAMIATSTVVMFVLTYLNS